MGAVGGSPFRSSLLAEDDWLIKYLIGYYFFDRSTGNWTRATYACSEWWERACFDLGWRQHGGSGLGRSYGDLIEMPLAHLIRDVERVSKRREDEAREIREARRRK